MYVLWLGSLIYCFPSGVQRCMYCDWVPWFTVFPLVCRDVCTVIGFLDLLISLWCAEMYVLWLGSLIYCFPSGVQRCMYCDWVPWFTVFPLVCRDVCSVIGFLDLLFSLWCAEMYVLWLGSLIYCFPSGVQRCMYCDWVPWFTVFPLVSRDVCTVIGFLDLLFSL